MKLDYDITAATLSQLGNVTPLKIVRELVRAGDAGMPVGEIRNILNPEMFLITASGINLNFAIAKTFAAIGMGLGAGVTVLYILIGLFGSTLVGYLFQISVGI